MKLYEVPRNSRVKFVSKHAFSNTEFNFHHIDGAYSYCTDDQGNIFHLSANAEVELIKAGEKETNGWNCC